MKTPAPHSAPGSSRLVSKLQDPAQVNGLRIRQTDKAVTFTAKVVPGSSRTASAGLFDGMLKVRLAAAPERGKANKCLIEFLARRLAVKRADVTILAGHTNTVKQIQLANISPQTLLQKLHLTNRGVEQ